MQKKREKSTPTPIKNNLIKKTNKQQDSIDIKTFKQTRMGIISLVSRGRGHINKPLGIKWNPAIILHQSLVYLISIFIVIPSGKLSIKEERKV